MGLFPFFQKGVHFYMDNNNHDLDDIFAGFDDSSDNEYGLPDETESVPPEPGEAKPVFKEYKRQSREVSEKISDKPKAAAEPAVSDRSEHHSELKDTVHKPSADDSSESEFHEHVTLKQHLREMGEEFTEQCKELILDYREDQRLKKEKRTREFYGGDPPETKQKRALFISFHVFKQFISLVVSALFSFFLIFVLTCTMVGTVAAVYVTNFMDSTRATELKPVKESFASYIYQMNKTTNEYDLVYKKMPDSHDIKLKTDLNKLPNYVKYAFICVEDERFFSHNGVDYKRTGGAVINSVLSVVSSDRDVYGGSTITQQLIKNITGDDEQTMERKMREIFNAMKFEQKYTKDEILEAYLNEIYFGQLDTYNMYGIEAAAIGYFGKGADELSITEAASLASIPKEPNKWNPIDQPENNLERRTYALEKMFELGVITSEEFEKAKLEELDLTDSEGFDERHPNSLSLTENKDEFENPDVNSWPVDTAILEFSDYLKNTYELESREDGTRMFNNGGYKLYLTADTDVQAHLDSTFADWTYFPEALSDAYEYSEEERRVQASFAVMDYHGHILGVAGQIGPKTVNLGWNCAYDTHRQPGSTIKPVTTYGYALENNVITYSTMFCDRAPLVIGGRSWPDNYDGKPSGAWRPVNYFLKQSINTLPAQLAVECGLQQIMNFSTQKLHLQLDPEKDLDYSPICVGGTTYGPSVINLANAYMPYGNGGIYYPASFILKAEDLKTGKVIIDNENSKGEPAVGEDTAYIMNKMLQRVISAGTGTSAQIWNTTLAGKTGTTENWRDITFVGLTPDTVSALWIGYSVGMNSRAIDNANSARIWKNVYGNYINETATGATFPETDQVFYARYCSSTGLCANPGCPGGEYGWYKKDYCPYCNKH